MPAADVTALVREAAAKSGLLWVQPPGQRAYAAWHVWLQDTAYVVSGPGEQTIPPLPSEVTLVLRSRDSGGRLLTLRATATALTPGDERWDAATAALKASRLNAPADDDGVELVARWAAECTVTALVPYGMPVESPGSYGDGSGAAPPPPTPATTSGWRPWHLRGRPKSRRGTPHR